MTAKAQARSIQPLKMFRQVADQHELISEYVTTALQTQSLFEGTHSPRKIKGMQSFLTERVVKHFAFEEEKLFPQLQAQGPTGTQTVVAGLVREHKTMLAQVASLQNRLGKITATSSETAWNKLQAGFGDLLRMLLAHTVKEDSLYQAAQTRPA